VSAARTAVIIDYQNMHLTGHDSFCRPDRPLHLCRIDPGLFARRVLATRAAAGRCSAELVDVQVFRGLPEPEYDLPGYQRNMAQQQHWQADPLVHVTHRPLRYRVIRECYSTGPGSEPPATEVEAREKGIDVLAALAVVTAASRDDIDLVIVATHDGDLEPAVIAVQEGGHAKIEAVQWYGGHTSHGRLHGAGRLWCTRLNVEDFADCRDGHDYSCSDPLRNSA
jgi:hypothetical protein